VQISLDRPERSYARLAEQLTAAANLTTVPGPFTRTEYYGLLAGSDVVLLPYRAERYRVRTSGVFAEALALGKVVVAPSGSWMEERLAEGYGAGVLFEEFEPESMASALVDALSRLDALSAKARERAPRWRADQCLEAFFDRLLDELAASGALHA
jgi:glycosyltransferase involved in cell wall biosynthesis